MEAISSGLFFCLFPYCQEQHANTDADSGVAVQIAGEERERERVKRKETKQLPKTSVARL